MISEGYELLSLFMRYIFIGLGVLILWRAYRWMRRDSRAYKKQMRALPDAGLVGEMVELATGQSQPLPREGIMGASRDCDIRVRGAGVRARHALFFFEEGKGLKVTPIRGAGVLMAGVELRGPAHALHGTQLQLGDALLRVRLFAGLNVPHPAQFQPDGMPGEEEAEWEKEGMPAAFASPFAPAEEYAGTFSPPRPYGGEQMPLGQESPAWGTENAQTAQAPGYQGNYTEDGQMTWQFAAYPLEELQRMQEMQEAQPRQAAYAPPEEEEADEALPYESPVRRRRRRSRP